jgi:hypothetical protein
MTRVVITWGSEETLIDTFDVQPVEDAARLVGLPAQAVGAPDAISPRMIVDRSGDDCVIRVGDASVTTQERDDLVGALALQIGLAFYDLTPLLLVHSAGVVVEDDAVLFVGPQDHGKTSLAFYAWRSGFTLIGDDRVLVDPDAFTATAFPMAMKIKVAEDDSMPDDLVHSPHCLRSWMVGRWRFIVGRMIPGMAQYDSPYPIRRVFLLERGSDPRTRIEPIDPRSALRSLLVSNAVISGPDPRVVRFADQLCRRGRVSRLVVGAGDISGAVKVATEMAGAPAR